MNPRCTRVRFLTSRGPNVLDDCLTVITTGRQINRSTSDFYLRVHFEIEIAIIPIAYSE